MSRFRFGLLWLAWSCAVALPAPHAHGSDAPPPTVEIGCVGAELANGGDRPQVGERGSRFAVAVNGVKLRCGAERRVTRVPLARHGNDRIVVTRTDNPKKPPQTTEARLRAGVGYELRENPCSFIEIMPRGDAAAGDVDPAAAAAAGRYRIDNRSKRAVTNRFSGERVEPGATSAWMEPPVSANCPAAALDLGAWDARAAFAFLHGERVTARFTPSGVAWIVEPAPRP